MSRIIAASLFFVLIYASLLDVPLSLAPGLSVKNAYLYLIVAYIMVRSMVEDRAVSLIDQPIPLLSLHICFIALISWGACSWLYMSIFATHINYSAFGGLIQLKGKIVDLYLVFLAYFFILRSKEEVVWTIKAMIVLVAIYNLVIFVDAFNILDFGLVGRIQGTKDWAPIGHANEYGSFIAFFLPSIIALASTSTGYRRALYSIGAVLSLIVLIATFARAAYVGIALSAVITGYVYRHRIPPAKYVRYLLMALVAAIILAVVSGQWQDFYDRVVGFTLQGGTINEVSSGRLGIWTAALSVQMESVLALFVGMGWDSYDQGPWFYFAPHNTYLLYFFELGIIGLFLFLYLMMQPLSIVAKNVKKIPENDVALMAAFTAGFLSLVIYLFFSGAGTTVLYLWAYVGVIMRFACLIKDSD